MRGIQNRLRTVARSHAPVLIYGESGTGKETLARLIHASSEADTGLFVKVSCPAIPIEFFDRELFGYKCGEFTGATSNRLGPITLANRGTLFLDDIAELDLRLQAKLLQVLQDGRFCSIGAGEEKSVEVRVICAASRNLEKAVAAGTFRQELFYRINVVKICLPALRDRKQDVGELAQHFIDLYNLELNCSAKGLSKGTLALLEAYHWPGNIRQLQNLIKRYVILGSEEVISGDLLARGEGNHVFGELPAVSPSVSISLKKITKGMVRDFERQIIVKMLEAHSWNRVETARALNISYRALLYKLKDCQMLTQEDVASKK